MILLLYFLIEMKYFWQAVKFSNHSRLENRIRFTFYDNHEALIRARIVKFKTRQKLETNAFTLSLLKGTKTHRVSFSRGLDLSFYV